MTQGLIWSAYLIGPAPPSLYLMTFHPWETRGGQAPGHQRQYAQVAIPPSVLAIDLSLSLLLVRPSLSLASGAHCAAAEAQGLIIMASLLDLPPNVHVSSHPCLMAKLSQLRSKSTPAKDVKSLVHDISLIIGCEALAVSTSPTPGPKVCFRLYPYQCMRMVVNSRI